MTENTGRMRGRGTGLGQTAQKDGNRMEGDENVKRKGVEGKYCKG